MHKVKVYTKNDKDYIPTYVEIDGKRMKCSGIEYTQYVGEVPQCVLETPCVPDLDILANLQFQFTPKTIAEASNVIRHTLLTDEFSYTSLIASIYSALKEANPKDGLKDVAKAIADRIIGEE